MKYIFWFCFIGMLLFFVGGNLMGSGETYRLNDAPVALQLLSMWGLFGAVILWVGMLASFFKKPPSSYRVCWGFVIVFGAFIGASIYFLFVYVRR